MYTISDIIDNMILRDEVIEEATARAICAADQQTSDIDRFPTIAEGQIHDAMCHLIKDLDAELEREDHRGLLAERAYDLVWDPCCNRIWKEARSRASEVAA